jgi:hypothetical protein
VSELSGDAWSHHTIKLYTRGVTSSDNNNSSLPSSKQTTERTISNMVSRGLSLGQVESVVSSHTLLMKHKKLIWTYKVYCNFITI